MQPGSSHLWWAALVVVALTGCHQEVHLFRLESGSTAGDSTGSPASASIGLREKPAQDDAAEGHILAEDGSTPLYTLRETHRVAPDGESWAFTLTGLDRPLSIVIYGGDGQIVARRRVAGAVAGATDAVIVVRIPGSAEVTAFQIVDDGGAADDAAADDAAADRPAAGSVRLVAVAMAPPAGAALSGATQPDGVLVIGSDGQAGAWRNEVAGALVWSVLPESDTWGPGAPVEIGYRYEPESRDTGAPGPIGSVVVADVPGAVFTAPSVELTVGSQAFVLKVRPGRNRVVIYPEVYGALVTDVTVRSAVVDGFEVERIAPMSAGPGAGPAEAPSPLPADLGTIFEYPNELWRSEQFEVFRWTLFPQILVMDIRDYELQSNFFKRLAFFVEKEGFRGQVLSDAELSGRHGYNAHNYNGAGLAAFFNEAEGRAIQLTDEEVLLCGLLEREGIIVKTGGRFEAGRGGILSISQESWRTPGLRELLLTHEAYHGVYFASTEYVAQIHELWQSLSDDERRYWALLLDGMQYDITDEYLVENEFHAYLLQQPPEYARWYFEMRSADRLRFWKPGEVSWLNRFLIENEGSFLRQARSANAILFSLTGLVGGDVYCLEPVTRK
jgi:hypothetical protein